MVSVCQWPGRSTFSPWLSHTKDWKKWYLIPSCLTLCILRYGSRVSGAIQGKELHRPQHLSVVVIERGAFGSPSIPVTKFTFIKENSILFLMFEFIEDSKNITLLEISGLWLQRVNGTLTTFFSIQVEVYIKHDTPICTMKQNCGLQLCYIVRFIYLTGSKLSRFYVFLFHPEYTLLPGLTPHINIQL